MKRFSWCFGACALLAALLPVQASAGQSYHPHEPDRINLPNGWQPEGITTDGKFLYVGSLANGAIWRANPRSGKGMVLAVGHAGRVAVGVDFDKRRDLLWVAGGDTGIIRAHDAETGRRLARYTFPSATPRFLNDLVVTRRAVFATDSFNQELAVVPLKGSRHGHHGDGLPPASAATTRPLTGDLAYEDGFNLNGIVKSDGRLLAIQTNTGELFRIHPETGRTRLVNLHGERLTNGDGLEIDDDDLYVVRNLNNLVAVIDLGSELRSGRLTAELKDRDLDVPATAALVGHSLWAVNARFGTTPTPATRYWITRLDDLDD